MNRIIVDVPNEKMKAFEEAMHALGIEQISESDSGIPEWQKKLVLERIAKYDPKEGLPWDEAMKSIRL